MHIVECDPDVILVSSLASIPKRRVQHSNGKHAVLRKLTKKRNDSIGMIDQDPLSVQPTAYLQKFNVLEHSRVNKLITLHYAKRNNRLIILCPRLEEWIIGASREANISLKKYNLSSHPSRLHAIINFRLNRFQELVEDLEQKSNRVRALKTKLI